MELCVSKWNRKLSLWAVWRLGRSSLLTIYSPCFSDDADANTLLCVGMSRKCVTHPPLTPPQPRVPHRRLEMMKPWPVVKGPPAIFLKTTKRCLIFCNAQNTSLIVKFRLEADCEWGTADQGGWRQGSFLREKQMGVLLRGTMRPSSFFWP